MFHAPPATAHPATVSARWGWRRLSLVTLVCLLALLGWDATGLDLPLARVFGGPRGFPWRDSALLVTGLHAWPHWLGWALLISLAVGAQWPWGFLRALQAAERWRLVLSIGAALLVISAIKHESATSCPWDLAEFGGVARHVSHWAWGVTDGGPGRCFPAAHASTGFAFLAGWFALRRAAPPHVARRWLVAALVVGLLLGFVQQVRGAHFMSHTLWTAWFCWTTGWLIDGAAMLARRLSRREAR